MNLAELLEIAASMFPEREFLRFGGAGVSFETFQDRVARTAGALAALGVEPGDKVAVLQTNTPAVAEALYASALVGAVFVPLNFRARASELEHMITVARPRVLLVGDRYVEAAREVTAGLSHPPRMVAVESPVAGLDLLEDLIASTEPAVPEEVYEEEIAVLMFTSGTTAAPKGVMLAHADLTNYVMASAEPGDETSEECVLVAAPLYHIAGLTAALTATFAGRRVALMRQFEAEEWLRLVAAERVTHAFLVPTMLRRVLDDPTFAATDLTSLRVLSYGAAPMPLSLIRRAIASFPPAVQFINAFGQTETTSTVTVLGPEDHRLEGTPQEVERKVRRLSSIGRALPDVEIRITDEQGEPVPPGEVGEIAIRTIRTMRGYYEQETATAATIRDGWLLTRDLGWMDEDGYIFLSGRKSDMIIRGGENIAPDEIEAVLESHPEVDEAGVIGVPDEEWGERVAAVVARCPGATVAEDELMEYCRQRLASFKKPEVVIFVDALPRNVMGKVLRNELRARYAGTSVGGGVSGERTG
jgi:acyl-CoA synthetase (AMP-forming)/AMP-acid ligase II